MNNELEWKRGGGQTNQLEKRHLWKNAKSRREEKNFVARGWKKVSLDAIKNGTKIWSLHGEGRNLSAANNIC